MEVDAQRLTTELVTLIRVQTLATELVNL